VFFKFILSLSIMNKATPLLGLTALILFAALTIDVKDLNTRQDQLLAGIVPPVSLCGSPDARTFLKLMDTTRQMAPWMNNLGNYQFNVSTKVERAQYLVSQGLTLYYGFNHLEAFRSFKEAARLDPSCAMAYWGQALSLGPNINAPMDPADAGTVFKALQKAVELSSNATVREKKLINALSARYVAEPPADRSSLDQAYAEGMKQAAAEYPSDPDVLTLYAEALMDLHPWNFWLKSGEAQPWTEEVVVTIEKAIAINNNHPGANHLYIHVMEASSTPARAEASADRLREMIPGAGHLVHMPSHIYIRIGRYEDGILANKKAVKADEDYITQCKAQGLYPLAYYPHNYHFLWACAQMAGQGEEALSAAKTLVERVDISLMGSPDWATLQHYYASSWYAMMRFGKWNELLQIPRPADSLKYAAAIWEYAQGLAKLRVNRVKDAEAHLSVLREKAKDPVLEELKIWGFNSFGSVIHIALSVLEGEILAAKKDYSKAIQVLEEAVKREDALIYQEPPDWHHPVRQTLGAVLFEAGKPADAEKIFREDLKAYANNGWSLYGLYQSLDKQGKNAEAAAAKKEFEKAFARADVKLNSARK
jgi:tetratricopeptide (TPR) repeat protein